MGMTNNEIIKEIIIGLPGLRRCCRDDIGKLSFCKMLALEANLSANIAKQLEDIEKRLEQLEKN